MQRSKRCSRGRSNTLVTNQPTLVPLLFGTAIPTFLNNFCYTCNYINVVLSRDQCSIHCVSFFCESNDCDPLKTSHLIDTRNQNLTNSMVTAQRYTGVHTFFHIVILHLHIYRVQHMHWLTLLISIIFVHLSASMGCTESRGSWRRMAWTFGSQLSCCITAITSPSVTWQRQQVYQWISF